MSVYRDPPKRKLLCANCEELYLGVQQTDARDGYGLCPPCEEKVEKYVKERDEELKKQREDDEASMLAAFDGVGLLIEKCYETAKEHGWWDIEDEFGEIFKEKRMAASLMLMVSELSEALEELRVGKDVSTLYYSFTHSQGGVAVSERSPTRTETHTKPEGFGVELADVLIRIFDLCGRYNIPIARALQEKMEYNKSRPYRHGGKKL